MTKASKKPSVKKVIEAVVKDSHRVDVYGKTNTLCLMIIAAASITLGLIYTKSILIPLILAAFVYTLISPIVEFFKNKTRLPEWIAVFMAALTVLLPMVIIIVSVIDSITGFINSFGLYQERVLEAFDRILEIFDKYKIPIIKEMFSYDNINSLLVSQSSAKFVKSFGSGTFIFAAYAFLSAVFLFFFIIGGSAVKTSNKALREIQIKVSAYLYIHIAMSMITAVLSWIVFVSAGMELAAMFATLVFVFNFIPNVGSVVAVILPLSVAFMQFGLSWEFFFVLAAPSVIQFSIGSLLEPKLLGRGVNLHPITVVCSLVFWALVWGIAGAFLAVPITSALRVILDKLETTRPFAEILSGKLPQ
jgi:AI-2 transport protein TqsA